VYRHVTTSRRHFPHTPPQPPCPPAADSSALEVLQRRDAEGEIDEAEYHRRLAELMGRPSRKDPATTHGGA